MDKKPAWNSEAQRGDFIPLRLRGGQVWSADSCESDGRFSMGAAALGETANTLQLSSSVFWVSACKQAVGQGARDAVGSSRRTQLPWAQSKVHRGQRSRGETPSSSIIPSPNRTGLCCTSQRPRESGPPVHSLSSQWKSTFLPVIT